MSIVISVVLLALNGFFVAAESRRVVQLLGPIASATATASWM
ncbi:hypothetical protein [Lentzea indica]|nr:hypothetical protein [Lentzea indica]